MTKEQLKKANKRAFTMIMIIFGYVFLSDIAYITYYPPERITWSCYVQIATATLALVASIVSYVRKKDDIKCAYAMLLASGVAYSIIRLVSMTDDNCMYAVPILIVAMTYLDKKIIAIGNAIFLVTNIIRFIMNIGGIMGDSGMGRAMDLFVTILIACVSNSIIKLLISFRNENMQGVKDAADKMEKSNKTGLNVADNIIIHFNDAMPMLEKLESSVSTCNISMKNIADSTENTVESIQQQASMCQNINMQASHGGEVTLRMKDDSENVERTIADGVELVKELKIQADKVSESSQIVEEVTNDLTAKVYTVEEFIDSILSITSQTNLLALNASIEAARAGEAGKGFAVVAEEIRKLSEDTKDVSNKITKIIKELNVETERANDSIKNAVDSVKKQNIIIENTEGKFTEVENQVKELSKDIISMDKIMEETVGASEVISDRINQISEGSQQIAVSSTDGLKDTESSMSEVEKCKQIFESIYRLAGDLKQSLDFTLSE